MDEPAFLDASRVAIIGLGLMGGSLALALRGRCRTLLGVDPDPATLTRAGQLHTFDQLAARPEAVLPQADVIVLAAPVRAILGLIARLPDLHPGEAVVLDLGSTKQAVCQALAGLPERFDPIGGHPMCGKETGGLAHAEAGLFRQAVFALTPLPHTSPRARALAEELAQAVGARPLWLDPATHDEWAAAVSHLPYLLACALAGSVPPAAAPLVGPGFRSASRLAGSSPGMMLDVLCTNRGPVLAALERFRRDLDELTALLSAPDDAPLLAELERSRGQRQVLLSEDSS